MVVGGGGGGGGGWNTLNDAIIRIFVLYNKEP